MPSLKTEPPLMLQLFVSVSSAVRLNGSNLIVAQFIFFQVLQYRMDSIVGVQFGKKRKYNTTPRPSTDVPAEHGQSDGTVALENIIEEKLFVAYVL